MKVTVIFGETRVVVPCGQGDFLVSELIEKAVVRYRKAAGKTADHYVHIHTLKSHSDGGILDLDDLLSDVVDDRDQIIAEYEEHSGPSAPQGGDGTSGSSVGSVSPDAFQSNRKLIPPSSIPVKSGVMSQPAVLPHRSSPSISTNSVRSSPALYIDTTADPRGRHHPPPHPLKPPYLMDRPPVGGDKLPFPSSVGLRAQHDKAPILNNNVDNRHSVEVTEEDLNTGTGLQVLSVRRDSEPNIVSALELEDSLPSVQKPWVHLPEPNPPMKPRHSVRGVSESSGDESGSTSPGFNRFNRDSSRQSLTGQNVLKWASAQERQQESHDQMLPDEPQALQIQTDMQKHGRREPLGQSQSPGEDRTQDTRLVVLKNEDGPLGIHVVPHRDEHNRESGLAIQGVEPGGRVHRTGQIAMRDVIVEINGRSLRHTNFIESQEIFREALQTNEIRLRVHRPAPVRTSSTSSAQDSSAPVSPKGHLLFKSVPPPPPQRSPNTMLSNQSSVASLPRHNQLSPNQVYQQPPDDGEALSSQGVMQASSRKLGKRIYIELSKGPEGLGFSITTRDNPAGGLAPPIYVKNILPKGAAIVDGRLKSGDRLLEVNNTDMTGKSQNEVVAILRNTKRGSTVTLCVSRLDSGDTSSSLPRQMPKVTNEQTAQNSDKKVLTFNIPLNETGSAGLGISVKGKTAMIEGTDKDLGIFIKAVIHGGAASKDGRLQINDQLLSVNGDDLKKKSNSEAMEALRKAMHTEGPTPGHIKLTVERKHNANVSSASTPEPWESSTTSDSTITGRTSTDGGAAVMGNKIAEVTLLQHNERKLSASIEPEQPVISPPDQAVSQNVIDNMRNPVLDRLTGGSNKLSELCTPENESYQIATQEDSDGEESYEPPAYKSQSTIPNPVQSHTNSSSVMMIEGDNNEQMVLQQPIRVEESKPKARPLSTIGGIGMAAAAEAREKRNSELESEKRSVSPQPTGTPSGEESNMNTFDREAMGRRSFSEKRKASNGKNKEVVAKVKALREEMKLGAAPAQPPKEAGREQDAGHSGPYKFKPLTLDLSVTSAYQPATPLSITELPSSPLYLQRTTSHQHPPRPSAVSDNSAQPSTQSSRQRTSSASSSSIGANGRRPVPAPRLSISSRPDADYQHVDSSMLDVQINNALPSSNGSVSAKTFLYPEINSHTNSKESGFSRASTLPVSAQRPQFDSQINRSRSKSPDDRARSGVDGDVESAGNSLTGSLEHKSTSRGNSKRGSSSLMKRINSRTSLTDMEKSERQPERTGPSLGLKKNSSFESLQAMVEQATKPSAESSVYKPPNRVSRGRGCNESFRAAVDRSYVPALSDQMDPDVKRTQRQRPRGHSASVHVSKDLQRKVSEENEFTNMRQAPMNASFSAGETDADKKKNKKTKNSGILGMFRFNKGRKSLEERQTKSPLKLTKSEEKERPSSVSHSSSKSSQQDSDRIQDYYRKLQEKQRTQGADNQQEYGTYPRGDRLRITPPASQPPPVPPHANGNTDRADQLAHIRAQHQRRHNERQGQYPNEDKEDFYERKIKERERDLRRPHHGKSKSIDNTASLEFFAAVNNRAYGTGAEFNPRHKSSQPSGMSSSALTRYSFYADPRYHDYHRSTQAGGHLPPPNDFNSNVSGQYPLPGGQRTAFTSYNNSLPKRTLPAGSSDYASINKVGSKSDHQMSQSAHQRYPSYDANAPFQAGSAVRHDVIFDYDDPQGAENSLYARVRKAPTLSHAVTNPAQV